MYLHCKHTHMYTHGYTNTQAHTNMKPVLQNTCPYHITSILIFSISPFWYWWWPIIVIAHPTNGLRHRAFKKCCPRRSSTRPCTNLVSSHITPHLYLFAFTSPSLSKCITPSIHLQDFESSTYSVWNYSSNPPTSTSPILTCTHTHSAQIISLLFAWLRPTHQ